MKTIELTDEQYEAFAPLFKLLNMEIFQSEESNSKQVEMEKFFLDIMKGLKKSTTPDYPNSVFYRKNGKVYIEHDKTNRCVLLSYVLIWLVFYDRFGLNYNETQAFTQGMLAKHKELGGLTTDVPDKNPSACWQSIKNWGD